MVIVTVAPEPGTPVGLQLAAVAQLPLLAPIQLLARTIDWGVEAANPTPVAANQSFKRCVDRPDLPPQFTRILFA